LARSAIAASASSKSTRRSARRSARSRSKASAGSESSSTRLADEHDPVVVLVPTITVALGFRANQSVILKAITSAL
jgi:hypothetical protein